MPDPVALVIEDEPQIRRFVREALEAEGWQVHEAATQQRGLIEAGTRKPDLLVLDLGLPDGDGLGWLQRLRRRDPAVPVLVLTARDTVGDRVRGLHTGADDYLVKPFAAEELDARVAALTRRLGRDGSQPLRLGRLSWLAEGQALVDGRPMELSPREFEVLGLLLRRAPRLVTKRALVDALAERNLDVGDSVAEVYVSRLRRKLLGSGVGIRTMRGFGYLLVLEEPAAEAPSQEAPA
jgi:two-component system response regulator TctD